MNDVLDSARLASADLPMELPLEALRWSCPRDRIPAETTEGVEPVESIIGQDRALKALKMGVELFSPGYNIFVCGLSGTGKATTIKTNIRANSKSRETTFSWIDSYTHLVDERTQRSLGMEITLSKWFFDGVMDKRNVLAISPLYFEITSGLGKWLYRAARKHAGGNGPQGFTIGFETLHQKSGSESSLPSFKNKILELARANNLPDISLEVIGAETPRPKLKMVMRRHLEKPSGKTEDSGSVTTESRPQRIQRATPEKAAKVSPPQEFVDPALVRKLLATTSASLRPEQQADASAALDSNASQSQSRRRGGGAQDTLDPEIYQAIRAECPGWDLDVLMRQFDSFLNSNPHELPRNYSKRFYGFMKKHHERNKHTLPGF